MNPNRLIRKTSDLFHTFKSALTADLLGEDIPISTTEFRVLSVIDDMEPCTAQDIVQTLDRDKAMVTRLIKALLEKALVIREMNPEDKRSQLLHLTAAGKDVLTSVQVLERRLVKQMVKGLSASDQEACFQLLEKMRVNLKT